MILGQYEIRYVRNLASMKLGQYVIRSVRLGQLDIRTDIHLARYKLGNYAIIKLDQ